MRMILEYLPGGALHTWLASNATSLTLELQLYILYQITLGMQCLHAFNVLHRDLAARNVLVGVDLACKVADYGLSRETDETQDYYRIQNQRPLPLRWMAPEVIRDLKWTRAGDVFSFGVVAFEVFSGGLLPHATLRNEALVHQLAQPGLYFPIFLFGQFWGTLPLQL